VYSIHRLSLFTRLLAPFVLVVTIAFAVEAWLVIHTGEGALDSFVVENLSARARNRLEEVDQFLYDRQREVDSWCGLSIMDDVLIKDRVLNIQNFLLERRRERRELYAGLTVLNRSEEVIASTERGNLDKSLPVSELTPLTEPGGQRRWSTLSADGSASPAILYVAQPIRSHLDPDPIGWLVAGIRWDEIEQIVAGSRDKTREKNPDEFFLLVNESGTVVAGDRVHSDAAKRAVINSDYLRFTEPAADRVMMPLRGLSVIAAWNRRKAFNVDRIFVAVVLGSTALGVLLASAVSFAIARYITGRLGKLVEGTALVARGDLTYRVEEGPNDEFGELARAFNLMGGELARARDGLEGALARWKALVSHAPDIILTVDRDGTIQFVNRVVPGLTVEQVIGTNIDQLTSPEHRSALREAIEKVFRHGEPVSLELAGEGPNGSAAWYSSRIGPVRRDAAIVNATIITTDITERKRLEKEVLEIAESERARIGRDLHDGLGQSLTGIALLSKGLEQDLAAKAPDQARQAKQIGVLIGDTIGQTRVLAQGLFPSTLADAGLRGALKELAVEVERMYAIRCRVKVAGGAAPEDHSRATHLFRIVQEAVNNAVRHGGARHIAIVLVAAGHHHQLAIRDDGRGIPRDTARVDGMGLRSMRYRASVLGGTLEVGDGRRGGTTVVCRFS
jgi:PAS domain S-box-containing protein